MMVRKSVPTIGALLFVLLAATYVQAAPVFSFLIDGNTFSQPFQINNNSTAGELVNRFQLDLSGTGLVFDPVDGGPPNDTLGVPFTPLDGTGATTGLVTPVTLPDASTLLDISFTDFQPGEFLRFDLDVDFSAAAGGAAAVDGDDMIGASAIIDFSNGQRLLGQLQAVAGNSDASAFTVTGVTQTPGDTIVPEPASLLLFGIGGIGLLGYGSRRRRK